MSGDKNDSPDALTLRAYRDGEQHWPSWRDAIFNEDRSHKCPTYVHRTPPCQASCPSGEDVRGWLQITRGIEKPPPGVTWQEYAFQRVAAANPFPSMMGRVCPAPCEQGCNRNAVDDFVGINAVEQFIGDTAVAENFSLLPPPPLGKKIVAIIGAGPAGLAAAYQLRMRGHASVVFDDHAEPGGMLRYGIPGYRVPRDILEREVQRIIDLGGIELRLNTRVGGDGVVGAADGVAGDGDGVAGDADGIAGDGDGVVGNADGVAANGDGFTGDTDGVTDNGDGVAGEGDDVTGNAATATATTISVEKLEHEFDAVLWALGCKSGRALPVPGADAPNCVSGVAFLDAFNRGELQTGAARVICVGGGDTSVDVVSVARRLGNIKTNPRAESVIGGYVAHDAAHAARREGAEVTLTTLFPREQMTAAEHEVDDALQEGVHVRCGVMPLEVICGADGRAVALRMSECTVDADGRPHACDGGEFEIECDLVVSAIGQGADLNGLPELDAGGGRVNADALYRLQRRGHFAAGDIIKPHLLTTAIGQAAIAADSIDRFLAGESGAHKRPKVDVHHFNLLDKLREMNGADDGAREVHNYEDRSRFEVIPSDELFLGHFNRVPREIRSEQTPSAEEVLGHFAERRAGLDAESAQREAGRCMSCGMCFECDNCVVYCPQDAVFKVKKDESTLGRYVDTDYARCIGCHICAEVCPSGYIDMGLGK